MVISQNGEVTQEILALLKVLALGNNEIEKGAVRPVADVVQRLRAKGALKGSSR